MLLSLKEDEFTEGHSSGSGAGEEKFLASAVIASARYQTLVSYLLFK